MESALRARLVVVLQVADRQRGLVTSPQLRECGISSKAASALVREGWLRRVRLGVYGVAGRRPSVWDASVAAALSIGPPAALSHGTAAAVHRLAGVLLPPVPELSVVRTRYPRAADVVVHRVARLDECDVVVRHGVRVTSAARSIVDLSGRLEPAFLARLIDEGTIARLWTIRELNDCLRRSAPTGRSGSRRLRDLLALREDEPEADSMLERRIIRLLAPFAPFETHFQVVLDGRVVILDIAWPWWRVGAEVDGWSVRSGSRLKLDRDCTVGNLLLAHGWKVPHVTAAMDDQTILRAIGRFLPPFAAAYS